MTASLPSYAVLYVKHPEFGWLPTTDAAMPASLAAHLIIDTRDLTPDEIARGQQIAATFENVETVDDLPEFMTLDEARQRIEQERTNRRFES